MKSQENLLVNNILRLPPPRQSIRTTRLMAHEAMILTGTCRLALRIGRLHVSRRQISLVQELVLCAGLLVLQAEEAAHLGAWVGSLYCIDGGSVSRSQVLMTG